MAYFLFIDESGQDRQYSPYEVLAGVAIEDRDLWNLIQTIQEAELRHFGKRYSKGHNELKGKKLLKRKVFRHASTQTLIPEEERRLLAKACLEQASTATPREWAALAQAKLDYVKEVFDICARFRCRVFASIVNNDEPYEPDPDYLRKDYAYLFERFSYYLEDVNPTAMGIVVFDELEKSKSHILVAQMERYSKHSAKGRQRSGRIMPEPFFVHSDLTTGIQIADLVAYIVSWAFRTKDLTKPPREELGDYVKAICQLRHRAVREVDDNPEFVIWSIGVIKDLRTRAEQAEK
jgi:Protein of unknown function (DUF3800)